MSEATEEKKVARATLEDIFEDYGVDVQPSKEFYIESLGKTVLLRKMWMQDLVALKRLAGDNLETLLLKIVGWALLEPRADASKVGRIKRDALIEIAQKEMEFSNLTVQSEEEIANLHPLPREE